MFKGCFMYKTGLGHRSNPCKRVYSLNMNASWGHWNGHAGKGPCAATCLSHCHQLVDLTPTHLTPLVIQPCDHHHHHQFPNTPGTMLALQRPRKSTSASYRQTDFQFLVLLSDSEKFALHPEVGLKAFVRHFDDTNLHLSDV